MQTLSLNTRFLKKLKRLKKEAKELSYDGADLNSYQNSPFVAIVGTRRPTPYGKLITEKLATELSRAGVIIVSGLALGIDSLAHRAVVKSQGRTISILPSGLKNIYPASHTLLVKQILANNGTIVSEYSPNHRPRKAEFLERNRLIAAFSDAVIIPEAAARSGSLNTAGHAKTMGIPILAVPGEVTSPMSAGTNYLIKNGAGVITETTDVLKILGIKQDVLKVTTKLTGNDKNQTAILDALSMGINSSHDIQSHTKLDTADFQTAVTMLEIQGRITINSVGTWHLS